MMPLTHILTHNGKCRCGNSGTKSGKQNFIPSEKRPRGAETASLGVLDTLRNQQVVCSSHITSSKKALKSADFRAFLRVLGTLRGWAVFADPHRDPHGEMAGKVWRAPNWILHDLRHELSHFLCCFLLCLSGSVGVGA